MDSFGEVFHTHLVHEPPQIASLSQYPIDIKACSEKTAKHSMSRTSVVYLLPMLWFNLDLEFEGWDVEGFSTGACAGEMGDGACARLVVWELVALWKLWGSWEESPSSGIT